MSNTESESSDDSENATKETERFQIKELSVLAQLESSDVLTYVEKLHVALQGKDKMLKKYKEKVKKLFQEIDQLKNTKSAVVQEQNTNKNESLECSIATPASAASLVDEIRQAAEQAQNLSGFVYEPTSGLYYDQKTGYYYNAEYGLYYDGNTGCYYSYDQEKNIFEFHSQVEVQPNQNAASVDDQYDKKDKKSNGSGGGDDVDESDHFDEEVQFDEHGGVITNKEELRILRKQKRRRERELEKAKKRKRKSKGSSKGKKESKTNKKRKKKTSRGNRSASDDEKAGSRIRKNDFEDGELSDSSTSSSDSSSNDDSSDDERKVGDENDVPIFKARGRFQDIAKKYPPSLRIIVQETNTETLKVGSLSLITFKGGSLGREGNHDVVIPDVNVSKCHLKFSYDRKEAVYKCVDLGSQNGTILNGARMSAPKIESEPHDLVHGSVIQIGQTKLLCHTHEGNSTCGLCEPGLLIEAQSEKDAATGPAVHLTHKEQLKKLQKRYGLENEKFVENKQVATDGNYTDRAATRRIKVGSSTDKEKTQSSSLSTAISSENKGFKMLSKLGWTEGEALGKSQAESGLLEPINVLTNEGKKGLGCDVVPIPALSKAEKKKIEASRKMQERYQKANDIFTLSDDGNS